MITISLKKLLGKMLTCCYSYGESGGWKWKKYADGTIDMWRTYSGNITDYGNSGGWYFYQATFYFPSGTIIGTDYAVHPVWKIGTNISVAAWCAKSSGSFTTYGARIGSGGSKACVIDMYVHGNWR